MDQQNKTATDKLNDVKTSLMINHNISSSVVDDFMKLIDIHQDITNLTNKIRFIYTDDEYGELAKGIHRESNLGRAYIGDAGIDLPIILSEEEQKYGSKKVWPNEREMLHTGIIMEFPVGYFGRIIHRSSTEKVHRLRVIEGVIDDYRGEILVQVHNQNTSCVDIYHGSKIAQLVLAKTHPFVIEEAKQLRLSQRGSNGFGSSGK